MAFLEQSWGKTSVSLNDPILTTTLGVVIGSPTFYTYQSSTDAVATIEANDYFVAKAFELCVGDVIYVKGSDASVFLSVTTVTVQPKSVHTSVFSTAGTVGTANITNLAVTTAKIADNAVTSGKLALNTIQYAKVTMTAADFNAAYTTPFLLVAAGGANTLVELKQAVVETVYGTTQFAAGGDAAIQYDSTAHGAGVLASSALAAATVTGWSANAVNMLSGALANGAGADVVNKGLYWSNLTADFTTGDSTIDVHLWYAVVSTTI